MYVSAITSLWNDQHALGMNSHPSPRTRSISEYIKHLQRSQTERDREQFVDKGLDTLLDGYDERQFEDICTALWQRGGSAGPAVECHFRTLVDFLLGHYMLSRGNDRRSLELSDLFTFEFTGEGPTRCMPLVFTTREGKENQFGRLETSGAMRHKNPLLCVMGALGFYLFWRWEVAGEAFPDLRDRASWYRTRLLRNTDLKVTKETPLAYNTQRDWVARAFSYVGLHSTKKTHIGRSAGAKLAELKGVNEEQIRRAGHWSNEQMIGCYLSALPRKFMRKMAGHPTQMGCFELRRASVTPPPALQSQIWPQLDAWRGRFGPANNQIHDLAATGLVQLLEYLREVILQDSVILSRLFPQHPIWARPVFQSSEYKAFAASMSVFTQEDSSPSEIVRIFQALPVVAERLHALGVHQAHQGRQYTKAQASLELRDEKLTQQLQEVFKILSSGLVFRGSGAGIATAPNTGESNAGQQSLPPEGTEEPLQMPPPRPPSHLPPSPGGAPAPLGPVALIPPQHCMSRAVRSIRALWQEWNVGVDGGPAIRTLDAQWGPSWRSKRHKETQWYSLRQEVMREIAHRAQSQRIAEEAAMCQLEQEQQQSQRSLDAFCKHLRQARKDREARALRIR